MGAPRCIYAAAVALAASSASAGSENAAPFELIAVVPLPGVHGRFDHFACDVPGQRLFVAALGNNTLEVIDLEHASHLRSIPDLHQPTGVLFRSRPAQVYVANGDEGSLRAYRTDNFAMVSRLTGLDEADNLRFDASAGQVYVGYGGGALAVVDSALAHVVATIALPGHPESFQLEEHGKRVFVNVPDAHEVVVVDRAERRAMAHWPLGKFADNYPMALDEAAHRLFVGCRNPPRLVVLDTESGRIVADIAISGDADDIFCDLRRHRLYISCGEGFLDSVELDAHDRYWRVGRQPTREGARTSLFVPQVDFLFLAVPKRGKQDAEIRVYRPR